MFRGAAHQPLEATFKKKKKSDFDEPPWANFVTDSLLTTIGSVSRSLVSLNSRELKGNIEKHAVKDVFCQYHVQIDPKNERQAI